MEQKERIVLNQIFTSDKKILTEIEGLLKIVQNTFGFNKEKFYEILVAITEAVINAIQHGNKNDPSKKVVLNIFAEKGKMTVEIQDEGKGFDASLIQDPRTPENIIKERGRGIFLIRTFADSVHIETGKDGTKVTMTFRI